MTKIQLVGYSRVAECEGQPGDIVDCQDEDRAAWMIKTGNAKPVEEPKDTPAEEVTETAEAKPKVEESPKAPRRNANTAAKRKKKEAETPAAEE